MVNEKAIAEELLLRQKQRLKVQELSRLLADWDASLERRENALQVLSQGDHDIESYARQFREAQLSLPGMGLPNAIEVVASSRIRRRRKDGKKPDVQIMEEVFREYGPLHVTDLVPIVQARGVLLAGKKKATLQVRDKMFGSKRFQLFGKNVWGLPDQELPLEHANGGSRNGKLVA